MDSEKAKRIDPDTRLMQVLKFTDEDLQANRDGYMTKPQRARLRQQRLYMTLAFAGIALFLLLVPVFTATGNTWQHLPFEVLCPLSLLWGCVFLAFLGLISHSYATFNADLYKGHVSVVEDSLRKEDASGESKRRYYYLHLEKQYFHVNEQVANGFFSFQRYRVYYAPHTRTILSAEWIDE